MSRRSYTLSELEHQKQFYDEKRKRAALPGNCHGCAHPNDRPNRKTCSRCCARAKTAHQRLIENRAKVMQGETVEKLETVLKMIYQLKVEMSRLREVVMKIKTHRAAIYQKGHRAGIRLGTKRGVKAAVNFRERLEAFGSGESLGHISKQELATMSHAYDNKS